MYEPNKTRADSKYFNTAGLMDEALIYLLGKKDFDFITVKEICTKAGVNRSTFYLHYESVSELLEETADYIGKKFSERFSFAGDVSEKIKTGEKNDLIFVNDDFLIPYLKYIKENKHVYRAFVNNARALRSEDQFIAISRSYIEPILERFNVTPAWRKYYMQYYVNGSSAIVHMWVKNGCVEDVSEISKILKACIRPYFKEKK